MRSICFRSSHRLRTAKFSSLSQWGMNKTTHESVESSPWMVTSLTGSAWATSQPICSISLMSASVMTGSDTEQDCALVRSWISRAQASWCKDHSECWKDPMPRHCKITLDGTWPPMASSMRDFVPDHHSDDFSSSCRLHRRLFINSGSGETVDVLLWRWRLCCRRRRADDEEDDTVWYGMVVAVGFCCFWKRFRNPLRLVTTLHSDSALFEWESFKCILTSVLDEVIIIVTAACTVSGSDRRCHRQLNSRLFGSRTWHEMHIWTSGFPLHTRLKIATWKTSDMICHTFSWFFESFCSEFK